MNDILSVYNLISVDTTSICQYRWALVTMIVGVAGTVRILLSIVRVSTNYGLKTVRKHSVPTKTELIHKPMCVYCQISSRVLKLHRIELWRHAQSRNNLLLVIIVSDSPVIQRFKSSYFLSIIIQFILWLNIVILRLLNLLKMCLT